MTNLPNRPIISPEDVFQFLCDSNEQRSREIRNEDLVERLSRGISTLNLN